MDFNIPTIITKRNTDSSGNPISVKLIEVRQVMDNYNCIVLSQTPDELNRIYIEGFTEVFDIEKLGKKNFKVDYNQGVVYFHPFNIGKTIKLEYYGIGYQLISAKKVFTKIDKYGNVIDTLESVLERADLQLELVETLGGAIKVIEKLDVNIKNADNLNKYFDEKIPEATKINEELDANIKDAKGWKDQLKQDVADGKILQPKLQKNVEEAKVLQPLLDNDIEVGTPLQQKLHSDIVEATKWKDQLHTDVQEGKVLQPLLEQTIADGNTAKQQLDQSIADAQDDIAKIEATGNEIIYITSSQWVYSDTSKMYEKQVTHTCNSENLHVTCKSTDTKDALFLPWKPIDRNNILLKSDEAIGVSVVISANYYKPLIDNTTTQEVIDARKDEINLKTKIDKIDEELKYNNNKIIKYSNIMLKDYKGICVRTWETNSLYSARFRNELLNLVNKTGINSIAFTNNTYQPTKISNTPFSRVPNNLKEIEDYIIFLKQNNLRIMFKHHVEIEDSQYVWRAEIEPADVDIWFDNYKKGVIEYAKICEKHSVESFSVGSEYKKLTERYPEKWIEVIEEVRKVYSGLLTYGANLNNTERDEVHNITFWDKLDFIGLDFYIYPIESGTYEQYKRGFYHSDQHKNSVMLLDSLVQKYNKPVIFCEYGIINDTPNDYIKALYDVFFNKNYMYGGFIWVFDQLPSDWFENNQTIISTIKGRNNVIKGEVNGWLTSQKSSNDNSFTKILEFDSFGDYVDAYTELEILTKGNVSGVQQKCKLNIKICYSTNSKNPSVEANFEGNFNVGDIRYLINNGLVTFYVKVPNFCYITYKMINDNEKGLFNLYEYQPLSEVDGEWIPNKNYIGNEILQIANTKIATGVIQGTMINGIIDQNITLKNVSYVKGISVNVNYINGGESYDVLCNGRYMGDNIVKFSGKHLTIQGNYSYELSYIIIYI